MSTDSYPMPAPRPSGLNAEWYAQLAAGDLRFQRCDACRVWRHPPRVLCAACGSERWSWELSSRSGRLFSWTVTHQPLHPSFAEVLPYLVLVVEMTEGVRLVCSARGIAREDLALELAVEIAMTPIDDRVALPYATLA